MLLRKSVNNNKIKFLGDFNLYLTYSPILAGLFSIVFFSLAGIPPLSGFFIKFFLFKSLFLSDFLLNSFFFIILIFSATSAFYYIRCVQFMFFNTSRKPVLFVTPNFFNTLIFVNCCIFLFFFFLFQPIFYLGFSVVISSLFF